MIHLRAHERAAPSSAMEERHTPSLRRRQPGSRGVRAAVRWVLLAVGLVLATPTWAQAPYRPARLADGRPDLEGVWENPPRGALLEPGPLGEALVVSPEQGRALGRAATLRMQANPASKLQADLPDALGPLVIRGEHRTRLLVEPREGRLPYTPAASKAVDEWFARYTAARTGELADNPEDGDLSQRCLTVEGQPPMRVAYEGSLRRIVQSPGHVAIYSEFVGEVRIVRIGGEFQPRAIRSLLGESVGHWEGDVLVVETRNFRLDMPFHVVIGEKPVMVGPDSRMIERFWRVSATELDYSFTVEDPAVYARPWLAEYAMTRSLKPIYEAACHEGNYTVANVLAGARAAESAAAARRTAPAAAQ
jgi:hypothetical protein